MKIADKYVPQELEGKWYDYWLAGGYFHSEPDSRPSYTIVIPPPNVTGMLHMGHMLNNTLQDVLVRRARMNGMNACWVPGTDHASIATEAKVVARLREQGIEKSSLSREEFLRHAWQWKEEHGGIILKQLRRLGASCDWERTAFTMDEVRSRSVIRVFVDLYNKGLIYRGVRMVNWDPAAQTALSDEEVVFCETHGKLYYLRYMLEEGGGYLTVATTRPETILGDVALCVNPNDPRRGACREGAARGQEHSRHRGRLCGYGVRNGCAEGDPGPRCERLCDRREIQSGGHRHFQSGRYGERQGGPVRRYGPFRAA